MYDFLPKECFRIRTQVIRFLETVILVQSLKTAVSHVCSGAVGLHATGDRMKTFAVLVSFLWIIAYKYTAVLEKSELVFHVRYLKILCVYM